MNSEQAIEELRIVDEDIILQNLIAQANARYILFNTSESRENFPSYTIKDDKLEILALHYLNLGCILAENNDFELAQNPLEKGASILEYIHGSNNNRTSLSNYYGLISGLSYYVGFQYSKSFILIHKFENNTVLAKLISLFLKRDYNNLLKEINKIIIDLTYQDEFITQNFEETEAERKIYEIVIAKSLNRFVQYFYTGNENYLNDAKESLLKLKEIAELKSDPGIWWVIRLLLLISGGIKEASVWQVLKNYLDINDDKVKNFIYSLVYLFPQGIYELFITQRKSLPKVLNVQNKGSIVSLPTSSGKTRIAEIAILDCLMKNENCKVLFIAPFKSLAFEIENSLEKVFDSSSFVVSHLYGGGLFSKLDEKIIEESHIIIATPEKAKAMLRGDSNILNSIKLVVLDEGHLLGPQKRYIVNEIFYEELRYFINKNAGKFLLLSAVLPNADELALWLTESSENVYKDTWRPSDERLGTLEWTGKVVNLRWKSSDIERETFNSKFIIGEQLPLQGRQRKPRFYPSNKNEAIAATAYKLRTFGPVLIFVGLKQSVFVMADAYMKCLGNAPEDFLWKNKNDWKAFELACIESFGEDNNWLLYARKGILCHNGDLNTDVRLPLEKLMRYDKPLVIIATSTLGQGVNLGISTVIFSTLYQAGKIISSSDFWNIAGRSGRAFKDHEGKVLIALDISGDKTVRERNSIRIMRQTIVDSFDKSKISHTKSGILILLKSLKIFASKKGIPFELLIQLISENKTQDIGEDIEDINDCLDWIDDSLLALQDINNLDEESIDYEWVENFFRKSLAYIQATKDTIISGDDVIKLIKSRIEGIVKKVGTNKTKWESIIKSGIPLNSNLIIEDKLPFIIDEIEKFQGTEKTLEGQIALLKSIEDIIIDIPIIKQEELQLENEELNIIRNVWLNGLPLSNIEEINNSIEIINKYYVYLLPWLLNGIAKKLTILGMEDKANLLEELSILTEIGLPNIVAIKIYQAGIRSRSAAREISEKCFDKSWVIAPIKEFKNELSNNKETYKSKVSKQTSQWIELLSIMVKGKDIQINTITPFNFPDGRKSSEILIAREINGKQYLVSPDLSCVEDISEYDINLESLNNLNGIYFKFNSTNNNWELVNENPYIQIPT